MIALGISQLNEKLLSMEILSLRVKRSFFDAPYYCSLKGGVNWAAIVDVTAWGCLKRTWLEPARGEKGWYRVPPQNTYIEVGADYITSGGRRDRVRHYYHVISVTSSEVVLWEVRFSQVARRG